jgi:hypothetical protein
MPETATPHALRTLVLRVLLGFLVLTALVAIVDVWTDVDEDGRVLISTFVISMASLLGLSGAARIDRNAKAPAGLATLLLASLAALGTLWLIWFEPVDLDIAGRVIASSWLWALTCALHSLIGLAALPERTRWLGLAAPIATYAGGVIATAGIFEWIEFEEPVVYTLATVYILATLANLAVLIVHLMHRHDREEMRRLVLVAEGEGVWRDARSGKRYRVSEA